MSLVHEAEWYGALTLTERVRLRDSAPPARAGGFDRERARLHLQRWRAAPAFAQEGALARRLAAEKMQESDLEQILGEPREVVRDRSPDPPGWLRQLGEAFSLPPGTGDDSPAALSMEITRRDFMELAAPLLARGRRRLRQGTAALESAYPNPPFESAAVEEMLLIHLRPILARMIGPTLALELNIARLRGQLQGETPEARYRSFVARLADPAVALAIFREYPVLARQLATRVDQWVDFGLELLARLCADWSAIGNAWGAVREARIAEIIVGVGDAHRSGRSVAVLRFDSDFRVVYKPRPLIVDVHFQELVAWLNQRGDHPALRVPRVLDRGAYGWTEFVETAGCTSAGEVQRFYRRQGAWLALLYVLEATDYHQDNLIAAGEHPVPIDIESLFHPRLDPEGVPPGGPSAKRILSHSVLRVGLLPHRFRQSDAFEGIEISGLGGAPGQLTPHQMRVWERPGTDEMRVIRKRLEMPAGENRPTLNGVDLNALDYADDVVTGFGSVYRTLVRHRGELLAGCGPLAAFAADPVRVIVRSTHIYGQLLEESFHPDLLQDALERDLHFDRLWTTIEQRPSLREVMAAERADLMQMDIPVFTTHPESCDLWTSRGTRLTGLCRQSGLYLARQRIEQLCEEDRVRQEWIIRAALTCLAPEVTAKEPLRYPPAQPERLAGDAQFLQAACEIGDRLQTLALGDESGKTWIALSLRIDRHWVLEPSGVDLYNGIPGMVLFLAYLGALSQDGCYTRLARAGLANLRLQIEGLRPLGKVLGAFSGLGGLIYLLTHLNALWDEPALLDQAEALARQVPERLEQDEALDVMGGCAGCIPCLLALHGRRPSNQILSIAIQCGDRLLQRAQPMASGLGWVAGSTQTRPLTGLSHGAAGIAWALSDLSAVTGERRFQEASAAAVVYERSLFSPEMENWPDLRSAQKEQAAGDTPPSYGCLWCNGASGVGLARLKLWRRQPDAELRAEIDAALRTTVRHGFAFNHSLCHGALGNLELLLQAGQLLGDPGWQEQTRRHASAILESIREHGWLCGSPGNVEAPGLMIGLAGIGYGLLRLASPERVPSVLTLEPPRAIGG